MVWGVCDEVVGVGYCSVSEFLGKGRGLVLDGRGVGWVDGLRVWNLGVWGC